MPRSVRIILTLMSFLFLFPSSSLAAEADYGAWFSTGKETPKVNLQDDFFNNKKISEQTMFACVTPEGETVNAKTSEHLSIIYLAAADVFQGKFSFSGAPLNSQSSRVKVPPKNGGYQTGKVGMQSFLKNEKTLLSSGRWIPYDQRIMVKKDPTDSPKKVYNADQPGWSISLLTESSLSSSLSRKISKLINTDANHPLELSNNLPESCALAPISPTEPTINDAFSSPGKFITNIMMYVPANIASSVFDFLQPFAFKYTFFTPHTERGDLMWQIPASCSPTSSVNNSISKQNLSSACKSGEALGFKSESESKAGQVWYIKAATFVQWMISGTYFFILFTAANLYIIRGSRKNSMDAMRLVPKLILSILLTVFSALLIGVLVSSSNLLVKTVFDFGADNAVGMVNTFLLQSGNIVGGSEVFQQLVNLIVGVSTAFFYLVFVATALIRQLLFVALIVLAPLAAFSVISNKWSHYLKLYIRVISIVIFMPVVLALIFKIGMSINPLAIAPEGAYGNIEGALGILMLLITLYMMYKAIILSKNLAMYGTLKLSFAGNTMSLDGDSGKNLLDSPRSELNAGDKNNSAFIPDSKVIDPGMPLLNVKSNASLLGGSEKSIKDVPDSISDGSLNNSIASGQKKISDFVNEHKKDSTGPGKRISKSQAQKYKQGLRNVKAHATANKKDGKRLTSDEVKKIEQAYAKKHGGALMEQNGKFYLAPYEITRFEGEDNTE